MKKEDMAYKIVMSTWKYNTVVYEYRCMGYTEDGAISKAVKWYAKYYTKQELLDIWEGIA